MRLQYNKTRGNSTKRDKNERRDSPSRPILRSVVSIWSSMGTQCGRPENAFRGVGVLREFLSGHFSDSAETVVRDGKGLCDLAGIRFPKGGCYAACPAPLTQSRLPDSDVAMSPKRHGRINLRNRSYRIRSRSRNVGEDVAILSPLEEGNM